MTTEDYKKRFIALFQEMEKELGKCESVEVERDNEIAYCGQIAVTHYRCCIRF